MTRQICFIDDCNGLVHGQGMCKFHWQRFSRGIDLFIPKQIAKMHGLSDDPAYTKWANMLDRCYNPNSKYFRDYGGRGIRVYKPWHKDAEAYIKYIYSLPFKSLKDTTIDRIDNDGNYEPGNLRWATRSQQQKNRRTQLSTTGVSGVYLSRRYYRARISINKKRVNLGTFKTFGEAVIARREAELEFYYDDNS